MRNIDSAARSRFFRVFGWGFPFPAILGFVVGTFIFNSAKLGLLIAIIFGFVVSCISFFIIEYLGSSGVNILYGKRKPIYSDFERFEGDIHQAQVQKSKKEYHKALVLVNGILKDAPDLPEALYLKAQIIWEGYRKADEAKNILEKVLVILPDKQETYHRWAQSLIDEIDSRNTSV